MTNFEQIQLQNGDWLLFLIVFLIILEILYAS